MYHITYDVETHPEGIGSDKVMELGKGACTALLIGSLLYPSDGSYSAMFRTIDGRTGEPLDDNEVWKAWLMLTKNLSDSNSLPEQKRSLCQSIWDTVVETMFRGGKDNESKTLSESISGG